MPDTASDLVRRCTAAAGNGEDFPSVWNSVLKIHPLVVGKPIQVIRDGRAQLEISLLTGQRLVFDSDSGTYSVA